MSYSSILPKELTTVPIPLVALTGLDIKHNVIHKEIWDGFYAHHGQKFRYKLVDGDYEYPKCKPRVSLFLLKIFFLIKSLIFGGCFLEAL